MFDLLFQNYIENIRKTYTKNFTSSDMTKKQIAVATYLIDRLALRAGNEKVCVTSQVHCSVPVILLSNSSGILFFLDI